MVKQFAQWTALTRPAGLSPVHRVESLVEEQANGPGQVNPRGAVGIEVWIVPQHREDIGNHEAKAGEGDLCIQSARSCEKGNGGAYKIGPGQLLAPPFIPWNRCTHAMDMGKNLIATLV